MRTIPNVPLVMPNGETVKIVTGTKKGEDGQEMPIEEPANLANAMLVLINQLPRDKVLLSDMARAFAVLKAITGKEKADGGVITLDDDHYDWFLKTYFTDEEGKRLTDQRITGALAVAIFGIAAIVIEQALKALQSPAAEAAAEA